MKDYIERPRPFAVVRARLYVRFNQTNTIVFCPRRRFSRASTIVCVRCMFESQTTITSVLWVRLNRTTAMVSFFFVIRLSNAHDCCLLICFFSINHDCLLFFVCVLIERPRSSSIFRGGFYRTTATATVRFFCMRFDVRCNRTTTIVFRFGVCFDRTTTIVFLSFVSVYVERQTLVFFVWCAF